MVVGAKFDLSKSYYDRYLIKSGLTRAKSLNIVGIRAKNTLLVVFAPKARTESSSSMSYPGPNIHPEQIGTVSVATINDGSYVQWKKDMENYISSRPGPSAIAKHITNNVHSPEAADNVVDDPSILTPELGQPFPTHLLHAHLRLRISNRPGLSF